MSDIKRVGDRRYAKAEDCPNAHHHTKCPSGYLEWHEWAEKKNERHEATRCPTCGFYAIWRRRPKASS